MKKIVISFLLIVSLFMTKKVYAQDDAWAEISAKDEITEGDKVAVDFAFDFKDAQNLNSQYGIFLIAFEISFDDSIFDIVDIQKNTSWDQEVDKADSKYIAMATPVSSDGKIHINSGKFIMRLYFQAKKTDKTTTNIKIGEYGAVLIDRKALQKEKIESYDYKSIESIGNSTHTFKINKSDKEINNSNNSIVQENKNINIKEEIKKEKSIINNKQNNNSNNNQSSGDNTNKNYNFYLKLLEIEGNKIDFNKHQSIYSIEVPNEVRELKVNAIAEASTSKVEITGADNLEENNKVIITVTAENQEQKKYIVNINRPKVEKGESKSFFEITDEQKKMGIIFAGAILGLGLIIFIIIRLRDRKIEKGMNKW